MTLFVGAFATHTPTHSYTHTGTHILKIYQCGEIKVYINIYYSNLFISNAF